MMDKTAEQTLDELLFTLKRVIEARGEIEDARKIIDAMAVVARLSPVVFTAQIVADVMELVAHTQMVAGMFQAYNAMDIPGVKLDLNEILVQAAQQAKATAGQCWRPSSSR